MDKDELIDKLERLSDEIEEFVDLRDNIESMLDEIKSKIW